MQPDFEPIAHHASYLLSAPTLKSCPESELSEICLIGRSNVGKSSIINALTNHKGLAHTSNRPGKTQSMNYYSMDERFFLVDLPGYGYAKVSQKQRASWERNMQEYLLGRKQLELVLHIVDCRHKPKEQDNEYFFWLAEHQIPFLVVLSKADKVSKNVASKHQAYTERILEEMNIEVPVIPVSAETGRGLTKLASYIKDFTQ